MKITPGGSVRILAIDVRPQRAGYAALETSGHLLDAGTRKIKSPVLGMARITSLLAALGPEVIVLRRIRGASTRHRPRTMMLQRLICHAARRPQIEVVFVGETELQNHFRARAAKTKHDIATLIAKQFPQLAWKLPEKRKIYDRESWSMVVFDAAALGVTYLARLNRNPIEEVQAAP